MISEVIAKAKQTVIEDFEINVLDRISDDFQQEKAVLLEVRDCAKWAVFADTVVLALPTQAESVFTDRQRIGAYLRLARSLFLHFMFKGLPVRAAIAGGAFYICDHPPLFAGKPLVDAHKWAESQQWAGCILTPTAANVFCKLVVEFDPDAQSDSDNRKCFASYVVKYLRDFILPDSVTKDETILCLNWPKRLGAFQTEAALQAFIKSQFQGHNKCVTCEKVRLKIRNTIEFALECRKSTTIP